MVYVGSGGKRFGQVIIVQHPHQYLSVYAYNKKNMVNLNDIVQQGQNIAIMGEGYGRHPMLYFEIRKNGKLLAARKLLHA